MHKYKKTILAFMVLATPFLLMAQPKRNNIWQNPARQSYLQKGVPGTVMAKTNTIHEHRKALMYRRDSTSPSNVYWKFSEIVYFTYDNQGRLTMTVELDTNGLDTLSKHLTFYGANGSFTNEIFDYYNSKWIEKYIDSALFDTNGALLRDVTYEPSAVGLDLANGNIYINTYDGSGNLTKCIERVYDKSSKKWLNSKEDDFTFNPDGSCRSKLQKSWNGSSYVNSYILDSVTWYSWHGNPFTSGNVDYMPTYYIGATWNGTAWVDTFRSNWTYDANGGYINTYQRMFSGKWLNSSRVTSSVDSQGNSTGSITYGWSWGMNAWRMMGGNTSDYTYDVNGSITQEIDFEYDYYTFVLLYLNKIVYSDFSIVTGIKPKDQTANITLSMYPNPASDNLRIRADVKTTGKVNILIYSIDGKLIMNGSYTSSELSGGLSLGVHDLNQGMYILCMVSDGAEITRKFTKE